MTAPAEPDELLNMNQAARCLGISRTTFRAWRRAGWIPAQRTWTREDLRAVRAKVPPRPARSKTTSTGSKGASPADRRGRGADPAGSTEAEARPAETPKASPARSAPASDALEDLNFPKAAEAAPTRPSKGTSPPPSAGAPPAPKGAGDFWW